MRRAPADADGLRASTSSTKGWFKEGADVPLARCCRWPASAASSGRAAEPVEGGPGRSSGL